MISVYWYNQQAATYDPLPYLWQKLKQEDLPPWFWSGSPVPSLTQFAIYFSLPGRYLFLPFFTSEGYEGMENCCGMLWIDECILGRHARAHLYFFQEFRRQPNLKLSYVCRETIRLLAEPPFSLKALYFFTDSRATRLMKFARRLGVQYIATLPFYYPESSAEVGYLPLVGVTNEEPI